MQGRCYVVIFSGNLMKIGRTSNLPVRFAAHSRAARAHGADATKIFFTCSEIDDKNIESKMIKAAKLFFKPVIGEYFGFNLDQDVRRFLLGFSVSFFEADEVRASGSKMIALFSDILNQGQKIEHDDFKILSEKKKVYELLQRNGPLTFGVIRNRFKNVGSMGSQAALDACIADGIVKKSSYFHPKNFIETFVYEVAE